MYCVWQVAKTPTIILNNPVHLNCQTVGTLCMAHVAHLSIVSWWDETVIASHFHSSGCHGWLLVSRRRTLRVRYLPPCLVPFVMGLLKHPLRDHCYALKPAYALKIEHRNEARCCLCDVDRTCFLVLYNTWNSPTQCVRPLHSHCDGFP